MVSSHQMDEERYIRVILPLRLAWEPCYRTSEDVLPGMRVNVTFSGRKYIGVVSATGVVPDVDSKRILPVNAVERHMETIGQKEMALWRFMADYYLCTIGEVYILAYPATKTAGEEVRARAEERREAMRRIRSDSTASASKVWKNVLPRKRRRSQGGIMPK